MTFTFKGVTARSMGLSERENETLASPSRDLEFLEITGHDGDIIIDRNRYNAVTRDIPVILSPQDKPLTESITDISNWLLTDVRYHDFLYEDDPSFIYRAIFHEQYNLENLLSKHGRAVLRFRFHPIKYTRAGLVDTDVHNGSVLMNPFNIEAKPRIILHGTGNMTLNIGSSQLVLRNVDRGIIIDTETQTVISLDEQRTQFDKMYSYPFPTIQPGNQTITFTGTDRVSIMTRIGALI